MTTLVDYAEAIDKAGGNVELAKELLGMLLQELPTLRDQLQQAIERADLQATWDHVHKIYGSTAYCGVPALRMVAGAMESAVKGQQLAVIQSQFIELDAAIQGPGHLAEAW